MTTQIKKKIDLKHFKKQKHQKLNIRDYDKIKNLQSVSLLSTINSKTSRIELFNSNEIKIMQDFGQINDKNAENCVSNIFHSTKFSLELF